MFHGNKSVHIELGDAILGAVWAAGTFLLMWAIVVDGRNAPQIAGFWCICVGLAWTVAKCAAKTRAMLRYAYEMGRTDNEDRARVRSVS